ncbi:hypothetical protein M3Y99_00092200 [Aphelenchoides fujianensis]|nr:hypothetical protein M3Y99_00092200 [Aphelenchoides fujianensis]
MYAARQKIAVKSGREEWSTVDHQWALIRRLRLAQLLASELPLNRLNLVALLETNLDYQYALKVAVHELTFLFANQQEVAEFDEDLDKLARFLRSIQINSPLASFDLDGDRIAKTSAIQSGEVAFLAAVADKATRLTCELAEIQSPLRRKTLQWKKAMESALAKTSETICHLMRELCHPESVFFDQHSWPKGFALDTTENVKRERRRLKPASLQLSGLNSSAIGSWPPKTTGRGIAQPERPGTVEASSQIRRSLSVTLIRTAFECSGEIVMSDTKLFFLRGQREVHSNLMQYPVFPFILSDYTSEFLNLTSSQAFRDLSRPMAIQDRSMEQTYVRMFNSLIEECNRSAADGGFPSLHMGPYHYGSHYSNTGIVAYFLVECCPTRTSHNNFDIPDRLFNSIQNTWRLSSSESTTDFKELIPEFFFFPEMFQNREHLELGIRQNGQPADDVHLPPWCPDGNARLFCLIHRQALESPMVTVALHDWIDLIFGYKQQGDAAVKAVNLFHPSTYRGRDLESEGGGDELYVNAVRTMIRTYGQMPVQLFAVPHLPHFTANRSHSLNQVENVLLSSVRGIRFGDFLGSPDTDDRLAIAPTCVFQLEEHERIDHLTALNHDGGLVCYGMLESTAMIIKYKSDREDALRRNFEFALTAVISWRFPDRILRIKLIQQDDDSCWVNLLDLRSLTVAKIAFSPSNDTLYIGFTNGLIKVYTLTYKAAIKQWKITVKSELFAHKSTISSLNVSDNFHVLLSTSLDGNFVRKLELTRPVRPVEEVVTLSCISPISCDVASAVGSRASLYTVNGDAVGTHREDEKITSVAMTSLDEGTGVNCLFLGLERGIIRVLEMWTMNTLRVISDPHHNQSPVISMHFTNDSRCLYAALGGGSGVVLCWQSASLSKTKAQPVFKMLNPFL